MNNPVFGGIFVAPFRRKWALMLPAILIFAACVPGQVLNRVIYHSLGFGNYGKANVDNVSVIYDTQVVPGGTHSSFAPTHRIQYSESFNLAVPATATIRWISADGKGHRVEAPMRSLVEHAETFHGFEFHFVDDYVDIYRVNARFKGTTVLSVERTKVFSSGN